MKEVIWIFGPGCSGKKTRNYNNEIMRKQHIVRTLYKWFKSMVEII